MRWVNNGPNDLDCGRLNREVGKARVNPVEFVVISIGQNARPPKIGQVFESGVAALPQPDRLYRLSGCCLAEAPSGLGV